jgi:hypothetical protein
LSDSPIRDAATKSIYERGLEEAARAGWAVIAGTIEGMCGFVDQSEHYSTTKARTTDNVISELRPTGSESAEPRSLSKIHGSKALPLHTDGAHLPEPPKYVVLESGSEVTDDVSETFVARANPLFTGRSERADWSNGIFLVDGGAQNLFYASAYSGHYVRFDPGCMTPADARARRVCRLVRGTEPDYVHRWGDPGKLLILDNHHVLHGRDASDAPHKVLRRILVSQETR